MWRMVGQQDLRQVIKEIPVTPCFNSMALILDWQIEVRLEGHHISKSTTIQIPKVAQKLLCVLVEGEDLLAPQQLVSGCRISSAALKARQKYNCIN